ncbi:SRPBCC family protein [Halorhabdus sp. BNX81]|uniref:SRPBCC family protein n=1 Tax=Halorhabdus sp. BNX81 TaxID=2980181 RepID=UPI0023DD06B3|nr:SRPBCC family protein [Halorhabdus sp. BNX81]WEL21062.1 Lipid binding protein [Halorhabdus sp. BNX81]
MSVYERSVHVDAPFEDVWEFHSTIDGLDALTPGWVNLRAESVRGPDGEDDPDEMIVGTTAIVSLRPFGVGPRQKSTTRIVERERTGGDGRETGYFVDEMSGGPFAHWRHTHRFEAVEGGTRITDHVEYRLAGGALGRLASPLAVVGFAPMFRYRHRQTKQLLE